ncbi:MAG TPA: glycogen synthase, partial [bacterium]|nr:glycogen synthase [bacterium]
KALKELGETIKIFTPYYKCCEKYNPQFIENSKITIAIGDNFVDVYLYIAKLPNSDVDVYFVDNKQYFFREHLYGVGNDDYQDNFSRFVLFQRAVLEYCKFLDFIPDVMHTNDWQTALIPVYLKTIYKDVFNKTKSVFTIHNMAYQGLFWVWDMKLTGLPFSLFNWRELEYYGKLNLMKGALVFADMITTVSPTYAREILSENFAYGLQTVLEEYRYKLRGIVNGVDYNEWSPETDKLIPYRYSKFNLEGKHQNKRVLCERCNFNYDDLPLFAFIGRLVEQKGIKFITETIDALMSKNLRIVILGTGDKGIENHLKYLESRYYDKLRVFILFNNELAHLIEAGADLYLMPSLFEPCGLNQLYSLKYGTIPIVRRTGGLADTVNNAVYDSIMRGVGTGFVFNDIDNGQFLEKIDRALETYWNKELWYKLIDNAMSQDWSWSASARKYLEIYRAL